MAAGRRSFAARLLAWYDEHHRHLPWRGLRDPWAIWVSEVMLQQTRVEAVRESYRRFLTRYPVPADFAAASDEELHHAWRGLGYYRRARLLREGARVVAAEHGGRLPEDAGALARLPGIGRYTAGAIASIAFGEPVPAIDGNAERVAARHRAIDGDVKRAPARRRIEEVVRGWLDSGRPGDFNQALMELGALVCTPATPDCRACPVARDCLARADGRTAELPFRRPRREVIAVEARAALVRTGTGMVLAAPIPQGKVNAGQVELPGPGLLRPCRDARELAAALAHGYRARLAVAQEPALSLRHAITHHRITLHVHPARLRGAAGTLRALRPDDPDVPWTTASRKAFVRLGLPQFA